MNKSISNGLRSQGLFGKRPIIGLTMFIIGSIIFIALAYNLVSQGPLIKWDLYVTDSSHALALMSPAFVTNFMIVWYYLGLQGVEAIVILLGLYFLYKRLWRELTIATVTVGGGALLFLFLSHLFVRPRPFLLFEKLIWLGSPNIPGFPSGHTLSIVTCCGFFAYLLWPKIKSNLGKALVITIALLIIFFVGFSRIYLGDHYLTDVLAGYAAGLAWFGLTITLIELFFQRYFPRKKNL